MWRFRNREFVGQIGISVSGTFLAVLAAWIIPGRNAAYAVFFSSFFWCILHLRRESRRYEGMRLLAGQIDELLHGGDVPEFRHFHEGDLEILRDEICKMTIRLKEQAALLKRHPSPMPLRISPTRYGLRLPRSISFWNGCEARNLT